MPSALAVVGGLAIVFSLYKLLQPWLAPLRSIPGPLLARYNRLWLFKEAYYGTFPMTNVDLHERYGERDPRPCVYIRSESNAVTGPIVRIAPNEYSLDDPAAAKIIYGSGKGYIKVRTAFIYAGDT